MMKLMMVIAVSSLALLGCKESPASAQEQAKVSPEPKPVEKPKAAEPKVPPWKEHALKEIANITKLKDVMCKCRDAQCVTKVIDALGQLAKQESSNSDPNYGEAERLEVDKMSAPVMKEFKQCMTAAMNHNEATAPHPPTTDTAREIADARVIKMTALKDAVCKCKPGETACVVAVAKAQQEWAAKPTPRPVDGSKLTAEDKAEIAKAFDTVLADYKKCTAIALGTAR